MPDDPLASGIADWTRTLCEPDKGQASSKIHQVMILNLLAYGSFGRTCTRLATDGLTSMYITVIYNA